MKKITVLIFLNLVIVNNASSERVRYKLETFDLSELKFSCVKKLSKEVSVLRIRDPNGYLYTVVKGDFIGLNSGRVIEINKQKVVIEEVYQNDKNGWETRETIKIPYCYYDELKKSTVN